MCMCNIILTSQYAGCKVWLSFDSKYVYMLYQNYSFGEESKFGTFLLN